MEIVAIRIYGQQPKGVLVATERECPTLLAAGWRALSHACSRTKVMSPPNERACALAQVDERFAYLTSEIASEAHQQDDRPGAVSIDETIAVTSHSVQCSDGPIRERPECQQSLSPGTNFASTLRTVVSPHTCTSFGVKMRPKYGYLQLG